MRVRSLLALLSVVVLLGACGDDGGDNGADDTGSGSATGSGSTAGADLDLVEDGKLTVCSDIPYAPFEYEEDGELKGIDVDLVKAIAGEMDLEAEFRDTDFDGIFAALAAGNCDMIASSVSITEERKKENLFSAGYFEIHQSLLVRKDDEGTYKDLADLKGKVVGVQSETTGAAFAEENAAAAGYEVKEFTGVDEMFNALQANQIEAIVQDFPINSYNAETTGETVVTKQFTEEEAEAYGFVIKNGNTDLQKAIDEALQAVRDDGRYDEILVEYLGEKASQSS